eukprot:Lankesteria_metandrocarpae@DN10349_c0_g1_i1.p1
MFTRVTIFIFAVLTLHALEVGAPFWRRKSVGAKHQQHKHLAGQRSAPRLARQQSVPLTADVSNRSYSNQESVPQWSTTQLQLSTARRSKLPTVPASVPVDEWSKMFFDSSTTNAHVTEYSIDAASPLSKSKRCSEGDTLDKCDAMAIFELYAKNVDFEPWAELSYTISCWDLVRDRKGEGIITLRADINDFQRMSSVNDSETRSITFFRARHVLNGDGTVRLSINSREVLLPPAALMRRRTGRSCAVHGPPLRVI